VKRRKKQVNAYEKRKRKSRSEEKWGWVKKEPAVGGEKAQKRSSNLKEEK
jgi:hypothetical protein